ncbi:MAG: four helix bundle protein [Bacteroidetes bacterium]|nr:four helix bundle protein [Bacteroidota bacterium]
MKGKIDSFKDLLVWQKAHELVLLVYKISADFPREEAYGLTSQIRRAAISIPANISEGFKRISNKEKLRFYNISQSSLEEVRYYILLAKDLKYIGQNDELESIAIEVSKLQNSLVKSILNRTT